VEIDMDKDEVLKLARECGGFSVGEQFTLAFATACYNKGLERATEIADVECYAGRPRLEQIVCSEEAWQHLLRMEAETTRLTKIEAAARNLVAQNGKLGSTVAAYKKLEEVLKND
jgi:hypothetical protein